MFIAFVDF
jgi:hypothetical protein